MSYEMENLSKMIRRVGYLEGRSQLRQDIINKVASLDLNENSPDSDYRKAYVAIMSELIDSIDKEGPASGEG